MDLFSFPQIFKLPHNGIKGFLDLFKKEFLSQIFTLLKIKDFGIFSKKKIVPRIFIPVKIKDFWIFIFPELFKLLHNEIKGFLNFFSTKNLFPGISYLWRSMIFGFFYLLNFSNFHTMEFKDFWIFSKKNCFLDFHTCEDQGFLDFLFPEIFKLLHNEIKGFLDFFKRNLFPRSSHLLRSRIFGFFNFLKFSNFYTMKLKDFWIFFKKKICFLDHHTWIKDFWIFFISSNFQTFTQWNSRIFGFFQKKNGSRIFTLVRIKDFWIFYFLKFSNFYTIKLKDFWIFSKKKFVSCRSSHLLRLRIFGFFFKSSNFQTSTRNWRIFGFVQKRISFPDFHSCEDQGFLDFFISINFRAFTQWNSRIFGLFQKKNFLSRIFTLVKIKDFWIFLYPEIF